MDRERKKQARADSPSRADFRTSLAQNEAFVRTSLAQCPHEPGTLSSICSVVPAPEVGAAFATPAGTLASEPESGVRTQVPDYLSEDDFEEDYLHPDDECGLIYSSHGYMVGIDKESERW